MILLMCLQVTQQDSGSQTITVVQPTDSAKINDAQMPESLPLRADDFAGVIASTSASSVSLQEGAIEGSLSEFQMVAARASPAQHGRQPDGEPAWPVPAAAAGTQTSQTAPAVSAAAVAQPMGHAEDDDRDWGSQPLQPPPLQRTVTSGRVQGQRRGRPSDSRVGLQTLLPAAFDLAQPDSYGVVRANQVARQQARVLFIFLPDCSFCSHCVIVISSSIVILYCACMPHLSAGMQEPQHPSSGLTLCAQILCAGNTHA